MDKKFLKLRYFYDESLQIQQKSFKNFYELLIFDSFQVSLWLTFE